MKPEDKKYILDNIGKKGVKKLSQKLGVKERKIKKFLEKEKNRKKEPLQPEDTKAPFEKKTILLSCLLIAVLGFAVYANSLNGEFIWDDHQLVRDNVYIKNWFQIPKVFKKNVAIGAGERFSFYRPLQILTYMIDYFLWRLNVVGYHLTNTVLHILAALTIYWLINILFRNKVISLFTSILFVIHPIHTEAVSYIAGRADSLVLLFVLLCFIFYIKYLKRKKFLFYILMLASFVLALLSRENSLILPALLLLYHYAFREKLKAKQFLSLLTLAFIYIFLRLTVLKYLLATSTADSPTFMQRLPGFFVALTNYTRLLFLPFHLHMEYGTILFEFTHLSALLGIFILSILLIYVYKTSKTCNVTFFSLAWFLIALLPVSNIYPLNAYMAEHWLYLPSVGIFLAFANFLNYVLKRKKLQTFVIGFTTACVVFYSFLTIKQNNYWKEPVVFYERTLRYNPDSPRIYNNLGNLYKDMGKHEEAITAYEQAIELKPDYAKAYNNLANTYESIGKKQEAITLYKKAIELNPNFAEAYNNLGIAYSAIGKKQEFLRMCKKAIELHPDCEEAHYNLGKVYEELGQKEEAVDAYKKAIELNPTFAEAYYNLGNVYEKIGQKEEAIALHKKAIELNPDRAEIYNNLGVVYRSIGDKEEAIMLYRKTLELDPDSLEAYNNLGNLYSSIGKLEKAIALYQKAIRIDPDYVETYNNLANIYSALGKSDEAIGLYEKAIELKPNFVEAYSNLGSLYSAIGSQDKAIDLYEKAMEINPDFAQVYYNFGNSYSALGKKEEAINLYKKAIALKPDYVEVYNNLGLAYRSLGRQEEAIAAYKKAIALRSDFVEAYNNLGNVYSAMGKQEEAMSLYQKLIDIDPTCAAAYSNLGLVYHRIGNKEEAAALYKKAIAIDPNYAQAYYNLSVAYFRKEQYKLAVEYSDKARALGFTNPAYLETLRPYR